MQNLDARADGNGADMTFDSVAKSDAMDHPLMPDMVKRSWERSWKRGLSTSDALIPNEVTQAQQRLITERSRRLICASRPEMTNLYNAIAKTGWMLGCVDFEGTVVAAVGSPRPQFEQLRLLLRLGVELGEDAIGTNGPGCALIERRPVIVSGSDHFLQEAKNFMCVAAPIFDPYGKLLGALDASCIYQAEPAPVMEALAIAARAVENRLVFELEDATFIRFHHRSEMIGTPLEGILACSADGYLLGLNQTARHILSIDCNTKTPIAFESLFDISFHRAVDKLRQSHQASLDSFNGMRLHARSGQGNENTLLIASRGPVTSSAKAAHAVQPCSAADRAVMLDAEVDAAMQKAHRAFARDIPILINGETGTGKEVVARLLHDKGPRSTGTFVAINCSSIPASLIESELFGYADGAFTGGRRGGASGKLEQAHRGTLFLDEIGDMPTELQARLLRVLQERSLTRVGGTDNIDIDISVICATHRNLGELAESGVFREDLYYRINGLRVTLPPLRERSDVKLLISRFLHQATAGRNPLAFSEQAMLALLHYHWPGNIRQLSHVIQLAAVLAEDAGIIDIDHLPQEIVDQRVGESAFQSDAGQYRRQSLPRLKQVAYDAIRESLVANNGNITATSRSLGMSRQTLYRKLELYNLKSLAGGQE